MHPNLENFDEKSMEHIEKVMAHVSEELKLRVEEEEMLLGKTKITST